MNGGFVESHARPCATPNVLFRLVSSESRRSGFGQLLLFRAHPGRSGNAGRFSEADIRSVHAFDRHVPKGDIEPKGSVHPGTMS
jgi:hypothetical protein